MKHLTLLAICASLLLAAAPYHIEGGAQFGTEAAEAYAVSAQKVMAVPSGCKDHLAHFAPHP